MQNTNLMLVNLTQLTLDGKVSWHFVTCFTLISEMAGVKIEISLSGAPGRMGNFIRINDVKVTIKDKTTRKNFKDLLKAIEIYKKRVEKRVEEEKIKKSREGIKTLAEIKL
jgi:hypothetical protein